uniref:Low affinity sulfate transporter 3-like n=2 Tax=Cicer arietinum TaxID=3827 RepID=A0A3Q7WXT2_CICAR|nr:low affinity sulfate transporter 3-like [Cicer arietinum]
MSPSLNPSSQTRHPLEPVTHSVLAVKLSLSSLHHFFARLTQSRGVTVSLTLSFAVSLLSVEAMAVGRSFASIKGYHLDGNKEMLAMGCMNIAGSFTSCYVVTGSFSRTAVNFSARSQSSISNIVMAVTVILCLELFTRLLYYTPMAILASIILSAFPRLIDIREAC